LALLISVTPKENYKLELKFDDGLEGEYSCTDLLQNDEFRNLADVDVFNNVSVNLATNDIVWDKDMVLCSNALYKQLELKRLMKVFKIDLDKE
jgi:hypothetical protein